MGNGDKYAFTDFGLWLWLLANPFSFQTNWIAKLTASKTSWVISCGPKSTPSLVHLKLAMGEAADAIARRGRVRTGGNGGKTSGCQNTDSPVLLAVNSWAARLKRANENRSRMQTHKNHKLYRIPWLNPLVGIVIDLHS